LSVAAGVVTLFVQAKGGAVASLEAVSIGARLSLAVVGAATYLLKFAWPVGLSFIYPLPDVIPHSSIAWSVLVLAVLSAIAFRAAANRPALLVGWTWYLVALVPVSGLVQTGVQAVADRYTYLPMIGISILVVWAIPDFSKRQWIARFCMCSRRCGS
jgi:hypothetical protein